MVHEWAWNDGKGEGEGTAAVDSRGGGYSKSMMGTERSGASADWTMDLESVCRDD